MRLLKPVWKLSWPEKKLLIQSIYHLARARMMIKRLGFKKLCDRLGTGDVQGSSAETSGEAISIGIMIERVSPHLPWNCLCLTQAVAGYYMLQKRGLPGTVFIGVNKEEKEELLSHAWLKSGQKCLTGEKGHQEFKVITILGGEPDQASTPTASDNF